MAILNEVYVGRLPEIDQMVTDIHNIREEYKAKGNISIIKSTKVIEKHIEEMWGFKAFLFDIYIDNVPNAYTWCVGSCINVDPRDAIECTNKGYRFGPKTNVAASSKIATSLLLDENISDEEVLAILLHEIGHSFVERANKVNELMSMNRSTYLLCTLFNLIIGICTLNIGVIVRTINTGMRLDTNSNTIIVKFEKLIKNIPGLRHIDIASESTKKWISDKISDYFVILGRRSYDKKYVKSLEKTRDKNKKRNYNSDTAMGRTKERLSDDFANMYGFGPQLATGLIKMSSPYRYGVLSTVESTDIQKKADDLIMQIYDVIDVHPGNVDRVIAMYDALVQDYKSLKVDPKIKAAMKQDIDELQKIINDLKKTQKLLKDYDNKYMKETAKYQVKRGNTETKKEKSFNDRKQINKDWEVNKIQVD